MRRLLTLVPAYVALAVVLTWPAALGLGTTVPGSPRTDLWNSLWSFWFAADALLAGELPYQARLLNHPEGGTLLVSDLPGVVAMTPLVGLLGVVGAYTLLVWFRLTLVGVATHLLAADLVERALASDNPARTTAPWIAGVGMAAAPVLLSAIHNGTSEAFNAGWAVLAIWAALRASVGGSWRWATAAGLLLLPASLASWYAGVVAFLFVGSLAVLGPGAQPWRKHLGRRLLVLVLGLAVTAPAAMLFQRGATAPTNLVGIKHAQELAGVRRTTGPADPVGYVRGGDFRSPDFRTTSRYGENFIHCHYLGWVLILGSGLALSRRRRTGALWLAGGAGLLLSLGPVWVSGGSPVILAGDRAVPLPYFLVEGLPGFSSLSLIFRLALAPALAAALLAAVGYGAVAARLGPLGRWLPVAVVLGILAEKRLVSPLGALPDAVDARPAPAILALAEQPPGAVLNFPVVGGRPYLYEQTVHGKAVAGTLNFPNNRAGQRVWSAILKQTQAPPAEAKARIAKAARARGIRYLAVHVDAMARPDLHDAGVKVVKEAFEPIDVAGASGDPEALPVRVYRLW